MNEELIEKAEAYALRHGLRLGERLGFGLHGIVFAAKSEGESAERALKFHRFDEPYARERDVYARLMEAVVMNISGLRVPRLLRWDDEWLALEMTIVKPPFLLDFASGFLDFAPTFSDEVWEDWELQNREQFGDDWPRRRVFLPTCATTASTCSIRRRTTFAFVRLRVLMPAPERGQVRAS